MYVTENFHIVSFISAFLLIPKYYTNKLHRVKHFNIHVNLLNVNTQQINKKQTNENNSEKIEKTINSTEKYNERFSNHSN